APLLEHHTVGESGLLVERLSHYARRRRWHSIRLVRVDDDVRPTASCDLLELHEEQAARVGKGRVTKAFGIEQIRARGPVAVLVGEHAVEHENLLSVRMIVSGKPRVRLVANHRCHLPRFRRSDEVYALAPHRSAPTPTPPHSRP